MGKAEKKRESWQERRKTIKRTWAVPFVFVEWNCERLSHLLGQWSFLDILGHIGRLSILIALVLYVVEAPKRKRQAEDQRKAKQYQAWQIINSAQGKPGGGGRQKALEDLYKDDVPLAGIDISKAYLPTLNLENADLKGAELNGAILRDSNLSGANLTDANMAKTDLRGASLAGANLTRANLTKANLANADLSEAYLRCASLAGADLNHAKLADAVLEGANLTEANLMLANLSNATFLARPRGAIQAIGRKPQDANLAGAKLTYANLTDLRGWQYIMSIEGANIYKAKNPPEGFVAWATAPEQGAHETSPKLEALRMLEQEVATRAANEGDGDQKQAGEK